jgi:hypothetical protein
MSMQERRAVAIEFEGNGYMGMYFEEEGLLVMSSVWGTKTCAPGAGCLILVAEEMLGVVLAEAKLAKRLS